MRPLGFLDLDGVWVDDRRMCRWALRGVDLTIVPGQLVALVGDGDVDSPGAVLDLLAGRRRPVRGRVSIDGIELAAPDAATARGITELGLVESGERRLCAGPTQVVVRPTPATLAVADLVVTLDDGVVRDSRSSQRLAAS